MTRLTRMIPVIFGLGAALPVPAVSDVNVSGDGLEDLAAAVARFRGTGHADVASYRVTVRLPDDPEGASMPLQELWRAPSELALRAAKPGTPRAIVRGLAIYLEPMYVARVSLLGADLAASVGRMRASCRVASSVGTGGRSVAVTFPAEPDSALPAELADLAQLDARLDDHGRITRLDLETREGDTIALDCDYDAARSYPQPDLVRWTLPNGELVEIRTSYAMRGDRALPESRHLVFPSRYDPGETEEIYVEYEDWDLGVEIRDELLHSADAFRYDANGLTGD